MRGDRTSAVRRKRLAALARWREAGRWTLGALLVVGGVLAWHMSATLQEQAKGLNRYARIDVLPAQRAEYELQRFLRVVVQRIADPDVPGDLLRRHLELTAAALEQLGRTTGGDDLTRLPDVGGVLAGLVNRLGGVRDLLAASGEGQALRQAETALADGLPVLHQLTVDLSRRRLQRQDQDLAQVQALIDLNRAMVVGFYIIAGAFTCFLWWEADGARQASREASANEERFKDIAEIASDWVWETDATLRFAYVSEKIRQVLGTPADRHIGEPLTDFFADPVTSMRSPKLAQAVTSRLPFRDIVCHVLRDDEGDPRVIRISGKPFCDAKGAFLGYRGVGSDISLDVRREARIRYLAEHDQLTGLPNRVVFQDHLKAVLRGARASDRQGVVLALDLDGFKDVNDTFGHDVGDALILAVADRLSGLIRDRDLVARLGGDEFAIVRRSDTGQAGGEEELARRILAAFKAPFQVEGKVLQVGVSIGIASFPDDGASVEDLMKASDLALYGAKAKGRGCIVRFDRDMTLRLQQKRTMEVALRRAIEQGELQLVFQPQVDLDTRRVIGAEALARWHDPELGTVPPDIFIRVAEGCGLILPLGRWVLENACREATSWEALGADGVVAVNVSAAQLTQQDLVRSVEDVLGRTGLPPRRLELEITESTLMGDTAGAIATLERLRRLGVRLAIDDFGTGYSSLSYLKRFSVHKVKIDRSFVVDLEQDEDDRRIVDAIVMLGRALGLRTIAEGVETEGQSRLLASLGCNEGQGYLFGRPMPASDFTSFCRGQRADRSVTTALSADV